MATAKFNGKTCALCGREFVAGETEIEKHPTMRGPRGGAKWVHSNPGECHAMSNPRFRNAGRRTKGQLGGPTVQKAGRKPRMATAAMFTSDRPLMTYVGLTTEQLVEFAAAGDGNAVAELTRRERDPATGNKLSWGAKSKPYGERKRKTSSNPLGYDF